ncbi:MAG: hypothetical protein CR997_02870 [Acidobacteria bacterium]|nr:MAG: hypothetical protein CR997_02870 [Acidobacteriota bacterium]
MQWKDYNPKKGFGHESPNGLTQLQALGLVTTEPHGLNNRVCMECAVCFNIETCLAKSKRPQKRFINYQKWTAPAISEYV